MQNLVTIYCKNIKQFVQIPCGTSLKELYAQLHLELAYPVIAARVNYKVQNLNFLIYKPKDIEFIDATSESGRRCYIRTLSMVMACAVRELWPECDLRIEHPISKGFYCTIRESRDEAKQITPEIILQLKSRMDAIIAEDRVIVKEKPPYLKHSETLIVGIIAWVIILIITQEHSCHLLVISICLILNYIITTSCYAYLADVIRISWKIVVCKTSVLVFLRNMWDGINCCISVM